MGVERDPARSDQADGPAEVLSVNQVVAYNLMRARRRKGWAQDEAAERLTEATGRKWSNATLSAAERSWQTGRTREFDANELVAFAYVFGLPVAFFLLPPEPRDWPGRFTFGPTGEGDGPGPISRLDLLGRALPISYPAEFVDLVQGELRRHDIAWSPSRADWYRPEEHWEGPEPEGGEAVPDDELPPLWQVRRRLAEALRLLDELQEPTERRKPLPPDGPSPLDGPPPF